MKKVEDIDINNNKYKQYQKAWQYALDMTKKEIHQGVEGLYHNLNTLQSRSGNQLPFTSLNYGTCTLDEGRMINKALLDVLIEGLGNNGVTSIFPCGIFTIKSGINKEPGTPNYDLKRLALESTTKRIYPNYGNGDCQNNINWIKQDRKQKQEYIDSLSNEQYNQLVSILEENTEIAEKIGLEIYEAI
jgi:ribonucleoside-triphosphate reductase